jgi:hypothetical protein
MGPELLRRRLWIAVTAIASLISCAAASAQAPVARPPVKAIKYPQARVAFPKLPARPKELPPASELTLHPIVDGKLHPIKPFDVQYTVIAPRALPIICRFVSDGIGHVRTETAGIPIINIIDYTSRTWTWMDVNKKLANRSKWTSPEIVMRAVPVLDAQGAKRINAQLVGQQVVAGHPCKGYVYTTPGARNEVWIADDIGIVVKATSRTPKGEILTTMRGYNGSVKPEEFLVPSIYKVVNSGQ